MKYAITWKGNRRRPDALVTLAAYALLAAILAAVAWAGMA